MNRFLLRIWRWLRAEIVLGFLIATVFFTGVLAWQAAYAPTDVEKQKCYAVAEKEGHKNEECKNLWERTTTDPIAFFTFWLVLFTGGLALSTGLLWNAGERQLALAQSSSERQLRAYVFVEKTPITANGDIFTVLFSIKNFGRTPAHNVVVEYAFEIVDCVDKIPTRIPVADENYSLGSIAPMTDFYELDAKVTGVSLLSLQGGDKAIYLNGSVTYDTVFTQGRVTNFRYLVGGEIGWADDSEMSADDEGNGAT